MNSAPLFIIPNKLKYLFLMTSPLNKKIYLESHLLSCDVKTGHDQIQPKKTELRKLSFFFFVFLIEIICDILQKIF